MIYIDMDDVVTDTGPAIAGFAAEKLGVKYTMDNMSDYDLKKCFSLSDTFFTSFITEFRKTRLLDLSPVEGAVETIADWNDRGWRPTIITGRPVYTLGDTRKWLESHGLRSLTVISVNKFGNLYNRFANTSDMMPFADLAGMDVKFACEDASVAIQRIMDIDLCPTAFFDKPWNRDFQIPEGSRIRRVLSWKEAAEFAGEVMA